MEQGCRRKWRLAYTDLRPCDKTRTISHIVECCPLTAEWGFIMAALRRWRRCFLADQLGSWHVYKKNQQHIKHFFEFCCFSPAFPIHFKSKLHNFPHNRRSLTSSDFSCTLFTYLVGYVRDLWLGDTSQAYIFYLTLIGNPTLESQWYISQPPSVSPNQRSGPHLWNCLAVSEMNCRTKFKTGTQLDVAKF